MTQFLKLLSENSEALTVIFTAVVTLSTVVYAVLTAVLVSETRKMREVQTEPKFHITIESYDFAIHIVRLKIQNIGLGPAKNVIFKFSPISGGESAKKLLGDFTQSNFFETGLRHFGPSQEVYSTYTQTTEDYEGKSESVLSFTLSYQSSSGKSYSEEIIIDMSEIKGRYQLGRPNLYSIAKSFETFQKDFSSVVSGFKKINTDVYLSKDREEEKIERERWYDEQIKKSQDS